MSEPIDFDAEMQLQEYMLRGLYLSAVCNFEFVLVEIISLCFIKDKKDRRPFKEIMIGKVGFEKKLTLAKRAVENHNRQYLEKYAQNFKNAENIKYYRNIFAHSKIMPDLQKQNRTVLFFEHIKGGKLEIEGVNITPLYNQLYKFQDDYKAMTDLCNLLKSSDLGTP